MQPAVVHDLVKRASDLRSDTTGLGTNRFLPVDADLAPLFPAGRLRRGSVVGVAAGAPGSTSLMLRLLVEASKAGAWVAIAGLPTLGYVAAAEYGLILRRTAVVPHLGPDWTAVLGALIDGFDLAVVVTSERPSATMYQQIAARVRNRRCVLIPFGSSWPGPEITLTVTDSQWTGLGEGAGRQITVRADGRGSAATGRQVNMWLPEPAAIEFNGQRLDAGTPRRQLPAVMHLAQL